MRHYLLLITIFSAFAVNSQSFLGGRIGTNITLPSFSEPSSTHTLEGSKPGMVVGLMYRYQTKSNILFQASADYLTRINFSVDMGSSGLNVFDYKNGLMFYTGVGTNFGYNFKGTIGIFGWPPLNDFEPCYGLGLELDYEISRLLLGVQYRHPFYDEYEVYDNANTSIVTLKHLTLYIAYNFLE